MNEEFLIEFKKLVEDVAEIKKIQGDLGTIKDTVINLDEKISQISNKLLILENEN